MQWPVRPEASVENSEISGENGSEQMTVLTEWTYMSQPQQT